MEEEFPLTTNGNYTAKVRVRPRLPSTLSWRRDWRKEPFSEYFNGNVKIIVSPARKDEIGQIGSSLSVDSTFTVGNQREFFLRFTGQRTLLFIVAINNVISRMPPLVHGTLFADDLTPFVSCRTAIIGQQVGSCDTLLPFFLILQNFLPKFSLSEVLNIFRP